MTEEELDLTLQSARQGDAAGECRYALLLKDNYFRLRAVYTLRALYKGILQIYDSASAAYTNEIGEATAAHYNDFRQHPSTSTLNELIVITLHALTQVNPTGVGVFTLSLNDGCRQLAEALPAILDRHYPGWASRSALNDSATKFMTAPSVEQLYDLLEAIAKTATDKGDNTLVRQLLADSILKGYADAERPFAQTVGYHTAGVVVENGMMLPVFRQNDNSAFPSICCGTFRPPTKATGDRKLESLYMHDLMTRNADKFNNWIVYEYNKDNESTRKASASMMQGALASLMAWVGPGRFTLDVIDFEHSGIGSYPARFLPEKNVRIVTREDAWEAELDSLEKLVEKRARMMQSIIDYNTANADMIEPWKIVVVQDYKGSLISTAPLSSDHPDQKEKDRYEHEQELTRRFLHLLERGYRYGLVFIIGSAPGRYKGGLALSCSGVTYATNPYNLIRVEGITDTSGDWLMKWLAGGEDISARRQKAQAGEQMDGMDGILTTEVADDGTDAEFRLDTVSHTHAFVIGKTGSGKSVLLHNIITGLVNSYGPDDLMLYLLDLKMGGVEFNRYRRLPHLRSLLVDNSDIQIVLEIMRDIDVMMRERGKAFRDAGVSNVKEFNRANPQRKMSQVIVVIDECHAIFSMGSGRGASKDQREITERLAKIAKEGRSQGIHLIFATQTLSGSEIPPDIQKNITDYYLLKCAPSDSEALVRGSSNKTEALPVGKVYYYHADKQALFQGIYNDNQACEELIAESLARYAGERSHGQFYFNGAQTFTLNEKVIAEVAADDKRGIHGTPGRMINLQQTPVTLNLRPDYSENVLMTGINTEEQTSRTMLALMASQIAVAACRAERLRVNVINCLDPDSETSRTLNAMADSGRIALYSPARSEELLKRLCDEVAAKNMPTPTLLYVFGQERFGELKRDQKFSDGQSADSGDIASISSQDIFGGLGGFALPGGEHNCKSFRQALIYLLENGPLVGLNTVIQLDKPDKLLFDDFISAKIVSSRFKHIIILRSEARGAMSLGLGDDIIVENLSADPERLRAFYYCDDDGSAKLFSPYEFITAPILDTLLDKK